MKRFTTFLFGMVVGAGLLFGALNYYLVRASDGFHLVPKLNAKLAGTYVDIRHYTLADWTRNPDLAAALIDSGERDLVEGAASDALHQGLDRLLDGSPR